MPAAAALVGLYVFVVLVVTYGLQILIWAIGAAVLATVAAFYLVAGTISIFLMLFFPNMMKRAEEYAANPNPKPPRPLSFDPPPGVESRQSVDGPPVGVPRRFPPCYEPVLPPPPALSPSRYPEARGGHPGPRRWAPLR